MRASYSIFTLSGYVLESFHGTVTAADLCKFARRQQRDARLLRQYHTLSDYTQAKLCLSAAEIQQLADVLQDSPQARYGRHALLVVDARSYVFATILQARLAQAGIEAECFGHREAALGWLLATSKPPPGPEVSERIASALIKAFPEIS